MSRSPLAALRAELTAAADPKRAANNAWFFKTKPGEYGHGDRFRGITVPVARKIAKRHVALSIADALRLLRSPWHEDRLVALLLLVEKYRRGTPADQARIFRAYLASPAYVNNWDLVDLSAPHIVGGYLEKRSRAPLLRLARSRNLWLRRIAIVSTLRFIVAGECATAYRVADLLLRDEHDLIHKAVGWMLRETGKRCSAATFERYLKPRYKKMPRTMLRYAIERFPEARRRAYLRGMV